MNSVGRLGNDVSYWGDNHEPMRISAVLPSSFIFFTNSSLLTDFFSHSSLSFSHQSSCCFLLPNYPSFFILHLHLFINCTSFNQLSHQVSFHPTTPLFCSASPTKNHASFSLPTFANNYMHHSY